MEGDGNGCGKASIFVVFSHFEKKLVSIIIPNLPASTPSSAVNSHE